MDLSSCVSRGLSLFVGPVTKQSLRRRDNRTCDTTVSGRKRGRCTGTFRYIHLGRTAGVPARFGTYTVVERAVTFGITQPLHLDFYFFLVNLCLCRNNNILRFQAIYVQHFHRSDLDKLVSSD